MAPILDSMKRSRQIKATDAILKRFAAALEYPHLMQNAFERKEYEEVVRLNVRIKAMPNSVNQNIRNNIKDKANKIISQVKKTLITDALRQSAFSSVEEIYRLFKNLGDVDTASDYSIILEKCFDQQIKLFLQQYHDCGKAMDEELVKVVVALIPHETCSNLMLDKKYRGRFIETFASSKQEHWKFVERRIFN